MTDEPTLEELPPDPDLDGLLEVDGLDQALADAHALSVVEWLEDHTDPELEK